MIARDSATSCGEPREAEGEGERERERGREQSLTHTKPLSPLQHNRLVRHGSAIPAPPHAICGQGSGLCSSLSRRCCVCLPHPVLKRKRKENPPPHTKPYAPGTVTLYYTLTPSKTQKNIILIFHSANKNMDSQPPDSAFPAAFSAHTSKITRVRLPPPDPHLSRGMLTWRYRNSRHTSHTSTKPLPSSPTDGPARRSSS